MSLFPRTIRSNPFKHLTFDELVVKQQRVLYTSFRSILVLFGAYPVNKEGWLVVAAYVTSRQTQSPPCQHIPALIIIDQPHMKLPIVIQISFVSVAGWLHLHVGNVSPHCPPGGLHTQTPHSSLPTPDQCQPCSLCADTKVGAVAWCLQIFSSRW